MGATIRTVFLFSFMMLLFVAIGYIVGMVFIDDWLLGMIVFLAIAAVINFIAYFYSSKLVLRSYRARIVQPSEAPRLHKIVQKICLKTDLPMPKLAIMDTATPNAFATGRNKKNAVVAATKGLLDLLSDDELEGVLAHEMAHVKNRDILVMSIAATIAGAISFASRILFWNMMFGRRRASEGEILLLVVAVITIPIAALLIRLGISRSREYLADREGALMIQRPMALARALAKLDKGNKKRPIDRGNPASASLFIVNPFKGQSFLTIFATHPPIKKRIERLEKLSQETGYTG